MVGDWLPALTVWIGKGREARGRGLAFNEVFCGRPSSPPCFFAVPSLPPGPRLQTTLARPAHTTTTTITTAPTSPEASPFSLCSIVIRVSPSSSQDQITFRRALPISPFPLRAAAKRAVTSNSDSKTQQPAETPLSQQSSPRLRAAPDTLARVGRRCVSVCARVAAANRRVACIGARVGPRVERVVRRPGPWLFLDATATT